MRWLFFALLAITLAPSLRGEIWVTKLDRPALFQEDRWRSFVRPGENVLNIPFAYEGLGRCSGSRKPASASA